MTDKTTTANAVESLVKRLTGMNVTVFGFTPGPDATAEKVAAEIARALDQLENDPTPAAGEVPATTQAAPEAPAKPIYQVQFHAEQGSSAWHDASEDAYHVTMPERRRIVYAAPAPATPAGPAATTASALTSSMPQNDVKTAESRMGTTFAGDVNSKATTASASVGATCEKCGDTGWHVCRASAPSREAEPLNFDAWLDREYPIDANGRRAGFRDSTPSSLMRAAWGAALAQPAAPVVDGEVPPIMQADRANDAHDTGYTKGWNDCRAACVAAARSEPVGWISVEDGLPEPEMDVIVHAFVPGFGDHYAVAGIFGNWLSNDTERELRFTPTHWMPLPAAPSHPEPAGGKLTIENAPIGTTAPAIMGGRWYKTQLGWKWNGPDGSGGTFPRPGGDWNGKLIEPAGGKDGQE